MSGRAEDEIWDVMHMVQCQAHRESVACRPVILMTRSLNFQIGKSGGSAHGTGVPSQLGLFWTKKVPEAEDPVCCIV